MNNQFFERTQSDQIASLTVTAHEVLKLYGVLEAEVECINYEFNATFAVTTDSAQKYALRININSTRVRANICAEIEWAQYLYRIPEVYVPAPIANLHDDYVTSIAHSDSGRLLNCVLYTWLEGDVIGDEPSMEQLHLIGRTIATLHQSTEKFQLSPNAQLPIFKDLLWGTEDYLFGPKSQLSDKDRSVLHEAAVQIMKFTDELYENSSAQIIHADLHGWNMMCHEGLIYIFDFDDCGYGLLAQDIAVALYYLDTPEQESALLEGYRSVRALPIYSGNAMKALLLQRRLMLLNYLCETNNQEHKQMLPKYLDQSRERASRFLTDVRG